MQAVTEGGAGRTAPAIPVATLVLVVALVAVALTVGTGSPTASWLGILAVALLGGGGAASAWRSGRPWLAVANIAALTLAVPTVVVGTTVFSGP